MTDIKVTNETLENIVECNLVTSALVQRTYQIHLFREVYLSISVDPVQNGVMFIEEIERPSVTEEGYTTGVISDLVPLHNFDYDGALMLSKVFNIYHAITGKSLTVKNETKV